MTADLLAGLVALFQWKVLLFLFGGVTLGAIFGALPGLTATMGVAVLTPLTFWVTAEEGLAMLLGIYCGAIPAGGIPAILINVPGTPASIASSWDGYPLAQKGQAGLALGINALLSAVGQLASVALYAALFFALFRLQGTDIAMCIIVIVILNGMGQYLAFQIEGLLTGSWI